MYKRQGSDKAAIKALVDFARVTVPPGGNVSVPFVVPWRSLAAADGGGNLVVQQGLHSVLLSTGAGDVELAVVRVARDALVRARASFCSANRHRKKP